VKADKQWEAALGHDGCWVSHPYFIGPAMSAFPRDHQLDVVDPDFDFYPDLLPVSTPPRTMAGLRTNVRVGIGYLNGWNQGIGCVAWDDLMEDLATLEISRAQTWQWLAHGVDLDDGTPVSEELVRRTFEEELTRIHLEVEEAMSAAGAEAVGKVKAGFTQAARDAAEIFTRKELAPFLVEASELVESPEAEP
jgi:malate synthase